VNVVANQKHSLGFPHLFGTSAPVSDFHQLSKFLQLQNKRQTNPKKVLIFWQFIFRLFATMFLPD